MVHHFNNVFRLMDGIDGFQVRQDARDRINLHLVVNGAYDRARDERAIRSEIARLAGEDTTLEIDYLPEIPLPPSGKRRYVISSVNEI